MCQAHELLFFQVWFLPRSTDSSDTLILEKYLSQEVSFREQNTKISGLTTASMASQNQTNHYDSLAIAPLKQTTQVQEVDLRLYPDNRQPLVGRTWNELNNDKLNQTSCIKLRQVGLQPHIAQVSLWLVSNRNEVTNMTKRQALPPSSFRK